MRRCRGNKWECVTPRTNAGRHRPRARAGSVNKAARVPFKRRAEIGFCGTSHFLNGYERKKSPRSRRRTRGLFLRSYLFRKCEVRSEEHTSELQSRFDLVVRLL